MGEIEGAQRSITPEQRRIAHLEYQLHIATEALEKIQERGYSGASYVAGEALKEMGDWHGRVTQHDELWQALRELLTLAEEMVSLAYRPADVPTVMDDPVLRRARQLLASGEGQRG